MSVNPKGLREEAYHEAGHAVAAFFTGARSTDQDRYVRIDVDSQFQTAKHVPHKFPGLLAASIDSGTTEDKEFRERVEAAVIVLLAGEAAQTRLTGKFHRAYAEADFSEASSLLQFVTKGFREQVITRDFLSDRARQLIAQPDAWAAVEGVAAALVSRQSLSWTDAENIMGQAMPSPFTPYSPVLGNGEMQFTHRLAPKAPLTQEARRMRWIGAAVCVVAVAVSIGTYSAASNGGGHYYVLWGAAIWGAWQFVKHTF